MSSRPPLERFQVIARTLSNSERISVRSLARRLEVNPKTIKRDLEFMRDRLNLPIDADGRGHFLSKKVAVCAICCRAKK